MKSLLKPIFRGRELWREFGGRATIGLALKKVISPVARVGSVCLMGRNLRDGLPPVKPISGIIAREAFMADIDLLDDLENAAERKRDTIARFERGDRWFVGIDASNGKLTNYRWVSTTWELVPELERHVLLKPGQALIYALYTVPEYRQRGIDALTRSHTYDVLLASGITNTICTIFAENTVSMKAGRRFLKKIGRIWYICLRGGRTRVFWWPNPEMPAFEPISSARASAQPEAQQRFNRWSA